MYLQTKGLKKLIYFVIPWIKEWKFVSFLSASWIHLLFNGQSIELVCEYIDFVMKHGRSHPHYHHKWCVCLHPDNLQWNYTNGWHDGSALLNKEEVSSLLITMFWQPVEEDLWCSENFMHRLGPSAHNIYT